MNKIACNIALWLTTSGFKTKIVCSLRHDSRRVHRNILTGQEGKWMSINDFFFCPWVDFVDGLVYAIFFLFFDPLICFFFTFPCVVYKQK